MIDIISSSTQILSEAGFTTHPFASNGRYALAFENPVVLGFLFAYDNASELVNNYSKDSTNAIKEHQFGLRRAGKKAWNTYSIFLTTGESDIPQFANLVAIEEDLEATRKMARANIRTSHDLRLALLPLLPLQSPPLLELVDFEEEIRSRATELNIRMIDAFLSNADISIVLQVLEDTQ